MGHPEYQDIIVRMNFDPNNSNDREALTDDLLGIPRAKMIKYAMIWFIYDNFVDAIKYNRFDLKAAASIIERHKR